MNWLDSDEAMSEKLLDIFEHSDFLADQFVRSPDLISVELLQKGDARAPAEPWKSMPNVGEW